MEDIGPEVLLSGSDEGLNSDPDVEDDLSYDSDALSEDLQTLHEMLEDLRIHSGPGEDEEFWKLRTSCLLLTTKLLTSYSGNEILTEQDRDNIRAFNLKLTSTMSRSAFEQMRRAFAHKMSLDSEWVILQRIANLARIEPVEYDCCINSCVAYTEKYQSSFRCPICQEPRLSKNGRARRKFYYLPLIPRLQAFFQSPRMIEKLYYRHHYIFSDNSIRDVFDSQHYRTLLEQNVEIDGQERPYKYFSGKNDIALSICTDGHCVFRRRRSGPSTTPILIQLYNLPPQIRTHLTNLICVGIIPNHPRDMASFLSPLDNELAELAFGIQTYHALEQILIDLHAYAILAHGDLVSIAKMLGVKGVNGYSPCRSCKIKGVRNIPAKATTYYTPLRTPDLPHQTRQHVDPHNLQMRQHSDFGAVLERLAVEARRSVWDQLAIYHGIREAAAIVWVKSIDLAKSFAWDWMHLLCENVCPNMFDLYSGRFKGLKSGHFDYMIPENVWEEIGKETTQAVEHIPASFVRVLGNIAKDRSGFTAESWAFWYMYVAPIVLKNRFPKKRYYKHLCALSKIMKTMLRYELMHEEIDKLESEIIRWVETYEEYVALLSWSSLINKV